MEFFYSLTPSKVLDTVDAALGTGLRTTGRFLTLNSLENRVFDLELEDDSHIVAKFYRPGRWTRDAILDEHRFLLDLTAAEVPAVAPCTLSDGSTLASTDDGILFALFPKVRGRSEQELSDAQLDQVGRFLARIHNVGAATTARHRLHLSVEQYGQPALDSLLASGQIDIQLQSRYQRVATALLGRCQALLADCEPQRIHGDCHLGNLLFHHDAPLFLDFDDMLLGPPVQDIWMVVRGRDAFAQAQRERLLTAYESLRAFDRSSLRLIEPLRALRMLHFSSWIARRYADPIFPRTFPEFTSYRYWLDETCALEEQLALIASPPTFH